MMNDVILKRLLISGMLATGSMTLVIAQPPAAVIQAEGKVPPPPAGQVPPPPPTDGKAPPPPPPAGQVPPPTNE